MSRLRTFDARMKRNEQERIRYHAVRLNCQPAPRGRHAGLIRALELYKYLVEHRRWVSRRELSAHFQMPGKQVCRYMAVLESVFQLQRDSMAGEDSNNSLAYWRLPR